MGFSQWSTRRAPRLLVSCVALASSLWLLASCACTTELRTYRISFDRDLVTDLAPEQIAFELCVDAAPCVPAKFRPSPGAKDSSTLEQVEGELVAVRPGRLHLRGTVSLGESSGTTTIVLRGNGASLREPLLLVVGKVEWDGVGCHSQPEASFF